MLNRLKTNLYIVGMSKMKCSDINHKTKIDAEYRYNIWLDQSKHGDFY